MEYFFLEKNSSFSTRKRVISVPFVLFASNYFLFSFRNFSPSYKFPPLQKIFLLRNNRSNEGEGWIDGIIRDIDMVNIRDTAMEGRAGARKEG